MICKICNSAIASAPMQVKEMMFGFRTLHNYYECENCESLQIEKIPEDLGKYYPDNYYSFNQRPDENIDTTLLRKLKSSYLLFNRNRLLGSLLCIGYKVPEFIEPLKWTGAGYNDAILDVGSGNGELLSKYCRLGFNHLQGIDPFLKEEFVSRNGKLKLLRKSLFDEQTPAAFDLVMLHHSFEHMDDPQAIFKRLAELVKPGKMLLIRTPVNRSYASLKYKADWVDMDPPRHLVIHSRKSIEILADHYGFQVERVVYDSSGFQFYGSEQYIKDIPLFDPRSYIVNRQTDVFTGTHIQSWEEEARKLNEKEQGDQACFYLRKK